MHKTAMEILKKLEVNNYKAFIVGGYPRDIYLKREAFDIDICTNATPKEIKEVFKNSKIHNENYGSVTLYYKNIRFEITTFRKEIKYENNRFPIKIKYIDDLYQDLKRRDFTINTLCIDSNNNLIDLLNSKEDIDNKIIKTVGDANKKIKEDILRSLRAIRFATTLNFKLDEKLKKSIKKHRKLLKKLSYTRKKEELDKIFTSPNCKYGIELIKELKLEKYLEISLENVKETTSSLGIWAQINPHNYQFNKNEKKTLDTIKELLDKNVLDNNIMYKYGLYYCCLAGEIKNIKREDIVKKYNKLKIKNKKEIDITSQEICLILNKEPNKFLNKIFNELEYKIINNELDNKKETLINYIKNV